MLRLWNGMSERTRRDYPRPKFEKRVKELTAYKGSLFPMHILMTILDS